MSAKDIIRAWKDAAYCNNLSETEQAAVPANPAGLIELTDEDLNIAGGIANEFSLGDDALNLSVCFRC